MSTDLAEVIEIAQERFNEIAPVALSYAAEKGFSIQALKSNKTLMSAAQQHPESLQQAITNIAAIGLTLSPAEHLAYLVPRGGKVCLDVSYQGMCRLATNSGSIEWIQSEMVYSNDKFTHHGMGEKPEHTFDAFATTEKRGFFCGAYAVAKTKQGDYLTTLMSADEVNAVKDRSPAGKSGPWVSHFGEMAKKTVVRRAFKMLPRTDEHALERMAAAVQLSNEAEEFEPLTTSPDLGQYSDVQKEYFDSLLEASNDVEMYVLSQTLEETEFNNLYHSFEKGTKGKYQRVIDGLMSKGKDVFEQYLEEFQQGGDISELSETAQQLIESRAI